ncbi:MAG: amidohydrolase family protein [Myxococcales bacterium]
MAAKSLLAAVLLSFSAAAQPIVFEHARLIDGTGKAPQEDSVLVVDGGRITAVGKAGKVKPPKGARIVDATGKTIIPGLITSHGHVGVVMDGKNRADAYTRENVLKQLLQYERYGVTSMLALGLNRDLGYEIRDEQRKGSIPGASLYLAGRGIGVPDGAPPLPLAPDQIYRPQTPAEATAQVKETASHHADMLKIWMDDIFGKMPKLKRDIYLAAIQEAHRNKIRVAAHIFYLEDAKKLAADGLDAFGHSIRDQHVDAELIRLMKAKKMFYIPTLNVDESSFIFADEPALLDDPFLTGAIGESQLQQLKSPEFKTKLEADPNLPKNRAASANGMYNLKALHDAGVKIALGTDSGGNPVRIQGWGEHRELELMVRAGLKPMDAIVAATRGSAEFLGAKDRGTLQKGKRADFVILSADPLEEIRNTRKIVAVWHNGKEGAKL